VGRLFWKFFLFIWLAQLAGILGTGALFWIERQQSGTQPPSFAGPPHERADHPPPPPGEVHARRPPRGPLPILPTIVGLVASLLCAAGLAWYVAKPIRQLRRAFEVAAEGDLEVRITPGMGGRRDELADLGKDFDRMTQRLQGVIEGQQRLLHDVSHEMRSPLARLQAAIGLARQQPARLEDSLQRIEREGERMDRLVGELLTLSRIEAGVGGRLEKVDMGELLAGIVEDARFECAARQVEIRFVPGVMIEVEADPVLLQRAVENVVRNAIQHSPLGGEVRIEAGRDGNSGFLLQIADQGPGVPESELEAIFKPFFRSAGQPPGSGYGLGLAIARRAVSAIGGNIVATNGRDSGLLVVICLPA